MLRTVAETVTVKPTVGASLILLLCFYLWSFVLKSRRQKVDVPEIEASLFADNREPLQDAYRQYLKTNRSFELPQPHHNIIVLPPSLIPEVKSRPEHEVSFDKEIYDRFNGKWTTLGMPSNLAHVVRGDVTRHNGKLVCHVLDEVNYAFPHEIGTATEWVTFPIYMKVARIVALLTGRSFIGLPVSRNEEWLRVIIFHTRTVFTAAEDLWRYPSWVRNTIAPFVKSVRDVHSNLKTISRIIKPVVEERMRLLDQLPPDGKRPDDAFQWLIDAAPPGKNNVQRLANDQLGLSMASIHTTGMNLTHSLFDLAAYPEYQSILRDEILCTINKQDDGTALITKQALTKWKKMDSFMKESQRVSPPSLLSINRKVTAKNGITLSNGLHLPYGTYFAVPAGQVAMDEEQWDNPEQFDGLRFFNLRKRPGQENKYQFVTTGENSISFGHGSHACPGRFFASAEIKCFLAYALLNYDMKLPDGAERPKNIYTGLTVKPDPMGQISWRKRDAEVRLVGAE